MHYVNNYLKLIIFKHEKKEKITLYNYSTILSHLIEQNYLYDKYAGVFKIFKDIMLFFIILLKSKKNYYMFTGNYDILIIF